MVHPDDRDLLTDTGIQEEVVSMESSNRGGRIDRFAGRDRGYPGVFVERSLSA